MRLPSGQLFASSVSSGTDPQHELADSSSRNIWTGTVEDTGLANTEIFATKTTVRMAWHVALSMTGYPPNGPLATDVGPQRGRLRSRSGRILMMNALLERITVNPNVCFGKPCIKGTRIWVSLILDFLANGDDEGRILEAYPQLTHDDIRAAIAYGAEASRERIISVPTQTV